MKELVRLVPMYLTWWNKTGIAGLPFLIDGQVSSRVLLIEYKKLPPIETLSEDEQLDLVKFSIELYPEGTEEQRKKAMKITYTIGTLL